MSVPLLKGTAFVTGAASGIGKATSFGLAAHGIRNLSLSDINLDLLTTTVKELREAYPSIKILAQKFNVCDENEVNAVVETTVKEFGRIDVAVNVAGIGGANVKTADAEESVWKGVIDVNLNGVWRCQRAELRAMLKQENLGIRYGRGSIVNVASMYGLTGMAAGMAATPYAASKHAVIGLTKSDANQYASDGIRINALCPGYVNTPLLQTAVSSGAMDPEIKKTPLGRLAEVEEISDCVVFLASGMSSFITGSSLLADGGYLAN